MADTRRRTKDQKAFAVLMFILAVLNAKESVAAFQGLLSDYYDEFNYYKFYSYRSFLLSYFTLYLPAILFTVTFAVVGIMLLVKRGFDAKKYAALTSVFFVVFGLSQAILIFRHYYARLFCSGLSLAFLALAGLFLLAKKVNKKVLLTLLFVCLIFSLIAVFFRISCLVSTLNNHDFSQYEGYDYFGNYYSNIEQYRYNEIFDTAKMALFPIAVIIMLVYLAVSLRHKDDENCFKRNWFIPGLLYFFFAFVAQTARYGYYNGDVTACFFTAALLLFCYWIYRDYNESFRIPVKGRTNRSSAGNAVNVAAKLRAIQDLYINGKLSDDEYEAWRRQILGS